MIANVKLLLDIITRNTAMESVALMGCYRRYGERKVQRSASRHKKKPGECWNALVGTTINGRCSGHGRGWTNGAIECEVTFTCCPVISTLVAAWIVRSHLLPWEL